MNRSEFLQGQGGNARQTMIHMQNAIQEAFAMVLSDFTATNKAFFLQAPEVTESTVSGTVTRTVTTGTASLNGEPIRIVAGSIDHSVEEVAWLGAEEEFIDVTPVQNIEQVSTGNQVQRTLILKKGSNYPAPNTYVPLDAPRQIDIVESKLQSRLLRKGVMYVIDTDDIPLIPANWSPTGLGVEGTPAAGLALCNGLNGTIDLRGVSPIGATISEFSQGAGSLPAGVESDYTVEQVVGAEKITLSLNETPAHQHQGNSVKITGINFDDPAGSSFVRHYGGGSDAGAVTDTIGGGQPHENRQPSKAVVWVKVV